VSGNVSLYNESKATGGGSAILPTPAIGGVGLMEDWRKAVGVGFRNDGDRFYLIGGSRGGLGQSLWLREIHGREDGAPPPVDLQEERRVGEFIRSLIADGIANAVHDVSDGGFLVALTEMCLAGGMGADVAAPWDGDDNLVEFFFGEAQARYVVGVQSNEQQERLEKLAKQNGITAWCAGVAGDDYIEVQEDSRIPLADLRAAHEGFFPKLMGASLEAL
jgi:phosphoribosylformylglycinamidine synthase